MAHRGRGWPQLRQAATAPTEGELQTSCSAAKVPTEGKPTMGNDEELTRDGPCSSRYASDAAGGMMMRPADLEAARQQRDVASTAFSKMTPVVGTRPWGGTNAEECRARWAQVPAFSVVVVKVEAATHLTEAAAKQQSELATELAGKAVLQQRINGTRRPRREW